jgi:hypothetical protein
MAEIDEPDMAAISFEVLKEVNNLGYDDYAIDELQFFVHRVQNIDLQQRCLVISLFPLVIDICLISDVLFIYFSSCFIFSIIQTIFFFYLMI